MDGWRTCDAGCGWLNLSTLHQCQGSTGSLFFKESPFEKGHMHVHFNSVSCRAPAYCRSERNHFQFLVLGDGGILLRGMISYKLGWHANIF